MHRYRSLISTCVDHCKRCLHCTSQLRQRGLWHRDCRPDRSGRPGDPSRCRKGERCSWARIWRHHQTFRSGMVRVLVGAAAVAFIVVITAVTTCAAVAFIALCAAANAAFAQSSPAFGALTREAPPAPSMSTHAFSGDVDAMSLADYLGLLRQISPAAEQGARDFLAAFLLRCGREMTTQELHRSFAGTAGDPVLMGLIRAAQRQDPSDRRDLTRSLRCPAGAAR